MYKYLIAVTALAAVSLPAALNAWADDMTPANPAATMGRPSLEQMKANMAQRHGEMMKQRDARRAEMDAHMDKCYNAMQAAKSAEEMKGIRENCHKEGKAMRQENHEQMKDMRADWKAKRQQMKAAMPAGQ